LGRIFSRNRKGERVAQEIDRALLDKAADMTAMALKGALGGQGSQPATFAGDVFREIWNALKEAVQELPERSRAGF
jgi:nicotinamide mononucleotide (NMN) deamidase PncC